MYSGTTENILASMTDEGLFERLATAILRQDNPDYRALAHTGVNPQGKTVKSPLDGICFVNGADPPHVILAHHTTASRKDLEGKWLHDPSKVTPRKGQKPTAPPGDLIKTVAFVKKERKRIPNLLATLVLTTNQEPSVNLISDVETAGRSFGIKVDPWSCSRLSHFLDNDPTGQWLRYKYLGIEQELLSPDLLHELSKKSLEANMPPDDPQAWVPRSLDSTLKDSLNRDVTFLVAGSGLGKSVACYRELVSHIEKGGYGLILPHQVVASEMTIEQAVTVSLRQLHPRLSNLGPHAFYFCSPNQPLILVVEDINRSGQAQQLVEKIASWSSTLRNIKQNTDSSSSWRLLCPLWPENLITLKDQILSRIAPLIVTAKGFSEIEGRDAVIARAHLKGQKLSPLNAKEISNALGNDPLLIGLHEYSVKPDAHKTIGQFVDNSIKRAAIEERDHPAEDYLHALRALAGEMLANRQFDLTWREVRNWASLKGEPLRLLGRLAHIGELIRFSGPSDDQLLLFRHDRVRDWLLVDAAAEMERQNLLTDKLVADPYYAEVLGTILALKQPKPAFLDRTAKLNPLALFYAFRLSGKATEPHHEDVFHAIEDWLNQPATHDQSNYHLRYEALRVLAETDSPEVPKLVGRFQDHKTIGQLARLRNGDLWGGIELCFDIEPGVSAPWKTVQIEDSKHRHGDELVNNLCHVFKRADLSPKTKIGALRLAGHLADPSLAPAIEVCWQADKDRSDHLEDYLWAFAECCADSPVRFLEPVCDAWTALSNEPREKGLPSPREEISDNQLRWAFRRWAPNAAIDYFIQRGSQEDLRWPIMFMLHGMDHPKAVLFVVQGLAQTQRSLEGTGRFSTFVISARDHWQHAQERYGQPMSPASRDPLLQLWQDDSNDKHLRAQAFSIWAATKYPDDISVLRAMKPDDELADKYLQARLIRGDQQAMPALIEKLKKDDGVYWWQFGRYLWSPELTEAIENYLIWREPHSTKTWDESFKRDWIISELIIRSLSKEEAEQILLKHWPQLRFCGLYIQASLYFATPALISAVKSAFKECPEPEKLLKNIEHNWGHLIKGHRGLTDESQIRALKPFLHLIAPTDLNLFWEACNDKGWFDVRREVLDSYLGIGSDQDRIRQKLESLVTERLRGYVAFWLRDLYDEGITWDEMLKTLKVWLKEQQPLKALEIVAAAIESRGTRKDFGVLKAFEGMDSSSASALIADTQFAVCRRSLR